jgi:hypothetical protein
MKTVFDVDKDGQLPQFGIMLISCRTCQAIFSTSDKRRKYCCYPCAKPNTPEFCLWRKVDKSNLNGCWIYTGHKDKDGYGRCNYNRKFDKAHRVAWIVTHGEIPKGISVCHKCDNPPCCNPDHLFLGTTKQNIWDCCIKERRSQRRPRSIQDPEIVYQIREDFDSKKYRMKFLEEKYKLSNSVIRNIGRRLSWAYLPEKIA